jgi:hypothetical protein
VRRERGEQGEGRGERGEGSGERGEGRRERGCRTKQVLEKKQEDKPHCRNTKKATKATSSGNKPKERGLLFMNHSLMFHQVRDGKQCTVQCPDGSLCKTYILRCYSCALEFFFPHCFFHLVW